MGTGKYAAGEFERRFLLGAVPAEATKPRHIIDHYLDNTRLRLRQIEVDGETINRKLGHKRRSVADDPTAVLHTSLYLNDDEFEILGGLPGRRLVKTRWTLDLGGRAVSVDQFGEALTGLVLLEVDVGSRDRLRDFQSPPWAGPEVTMIEAFTGGQLAGRGTTDLPAPWSEPA